MKEECGVTFDSIENAEELIAVHGSGQKIAKIDFKANQKKNDYFVTVTWMDGFTFTFTGFAWGYGGTGPMGLNHFLSLCGVQDLNADMIPLDKYGITDATQFIGEAPHA